MATAAPGGYCFGAREVNTNLDIDQILLFGRLLAASPLATTSFGEPSELSMVQTPAGRQTGRRRTAQFAARAGSVP
jgi:hypothetical protein